MSTETVQEIVVLAGEPDEHEIAALTAVLLALAARARRAAPAPAPRPAPWARPALAAPGAWAAGPARHLGEAA